MLKWIRILLAAGLMITGILFINAMAKRMRPGTDILKDPHSATWTDQTDVLNPNKGSFAIAYAVVGGLCILSSAILVGSMTDKKS